MNKVKQVSKAIVRRQLENKVLTNIQVILFHPDGTTTMNLDSSPHCANGIERAAHQLGMIVTNEVSKLENAEIHIATWEK